MGPECEPHSRRYHLAGRLSNGPDLSNTHSSEREAKGQRTSKHQRRSSPASSRLLEKSQILTEVVMQLTRPCRLHWKRPTLPGQQVCVGRRGHCRLSASVRRKLKSTPDPVKTHPFDQKLHQGTCQIGCAMFSFWVVPLCLRTRLLAASSKVRKGTLTQLTQ